jgi:hypothetical protein
MTKKAKSHPPDEPQQDDPKPIAMNWRWYWIRAALLTVLIFILMMWFLYPTRGNIAILWSAGLAAAMLGYFVASYYFLNR